MCVFYANQQLSYMLYAKLARQSVTGSVLCGIAKALSEDDPSIRVLSFALLAPFRHIDCYMYVVSACFGFEEECSM
jgi:hypothetical protein